MNECPRCGYCPTCGRGGHRDADFFPKVPQPPKWQLEADEARRWTVVRDMIEKERETKK